MLRLKNRNPLPILFAIGIAVFAGGAIYATEKQSLEIKVLSLDSSVNLANHIIEIAVFPRFESSVFFPAPILHVSLGEPDAFEIAVAPNETTLYIKLKPTVSPVALKRHRILTNMHVQSGETIYSFVILNGLLERDAPRSVAIGGDPIKLAVERKQKEWEQSFEKRFQEKVDAILQDLFARAPEKAKNGKGALLLLNTNPQKIKKDVDKGRYVCYQNLSLFNLCVDTKKSP